MFKQIFVEKEVANNHYTNQILTQVGNDKVKEIEKIEDVFGKVYRPYLQKREGLNLFIGKKRGALIKEAPEAYGTAEGKHYYFIHAYNCIYECQYCYLQGHFSSPDIVLFVNHDEILHEMDQLIQATDAKETIWFHAGEFSDSLALSGLTREWERYFDFFRARPRAYLELRTKSVNINTIKDLRPSENIFISFSLSPNKMAKELDLKTPGTAARIRAMRSLQQRGHFLALHLDPMVHAHDFYEQYEELLATLARELDLSKIQYVSLGVVRFPKKVFHKFSKNYPNGQLNNQKFYSGQDDKMRYFKPLRLKMLRDVKHLCLDHGIAPDKIYYCMD